MTCTLSCASSILPPSLCPLSLSPIATPVPFPHAPQDLLIYSVVVLIDAGTLGLCCVLCIVSLYYLIVFKLQVGDSWRVGGGNSGEGGQHSMGRCSACHNGPCAVRAPLSVLQKSVLFLILGNNDLYNFQ